MAVERTLVLVKPDAMRRALAGEIVGRLERRGFELRAARLLTVDRSLAEEHYAEHTEKPFFGELVDFITSAPTLALVLEGESAISVGCRTRHDSRRPLALDAGQPRPRLRLGRIGHARNRPVVRR